MWSPGGLPAPPAGIHGRRQPDLAGGAHPGLLLTFLRGQVVLVGLERVAPAACNVVHPRRPLLLPVTSDGAFGEFGGGLAVS
jgi:hypothetical protein